MPSRASIVSAAVAALLSLSGLVPLPAAHAATDPMKTGPTKSASPCAQASCIPVREASNKGRCVADCKAARDRCLQGRHHAAADRCWVAYGRCTNDCGEALDR